MARKTSFVGISPNRPHPVAVLAFDGVVLGDLAAPCELFGRARHASGALAYRVRVCSARPEVKAGLVALSTRWRLSALARAETIIVPGVEEIGGSLPAPELRALRRAIARGARVASICTGAFLLAQTGALDGLTATTHWRAAAELARRHPRVAVDPSVLYVDNGRLLTSAGAAAGMDLCLHLIRRDLGAVAAAAVARDAVMAPERSGGQAQFMVGPEPAGDEASSLGTLLAWLEAHLAEPLHLEAIARKAAMSTRTLSRRFREGVGATPAAWVNEKRVRRAQQLLETSSLSVERVAAGVGFGSATVLREHFGRVVGTTPTAYRRAFSVR